jgi:ABC-2 type transport system ATP-binding protein
VLKIEGLTKKYGDKKAVDNLSLHIQKGEIYGFIGHNGAGKTTTIKSCAGILHFEGGEIYVDGISVRENPIEVKRQIAYIPDNPSIYEFLSGIKYLNFIADIYRVTEAERNMLIKRYSDIFELTADLAKPVSEYSHGMKQKLVVISALIHKPKLMMLDEPFVGLDPKSTHALKLIMREICDNGGAIFFSTHILEVAEKLCDKIAIIRNGALVESGPTAQVTAKSSLEAVFLELVDNV